MPKLSRWSVYIHQEVPCDSPEQPLSLLALAGCRAVGPCGRHRRGLVRRADALTATPAAIRVESRRNEDTLARSSRRDLGERYLAAGQVLKIDVLDVDLAGTVRPARRTGRAAV